MIKHCVIVAVLCILVGLLASCVGAGSAVDPTAGSERVFKASETEVDSAITNAFARGRYDDMLFGQAAGHDYLARGWHPTNGFLLQPGTGSRYQGYFHITVVPATTNQTTVIVRTIKAEVIDGREPGIHGGWAHHFRKIRPIPREETNVLSAIATQLK